jgi:small-conductance mechanosensitive channel
VEELRREALAQAIVWLPTVAVALSLLLVFLILSRLAHFGVLRVVERTRAHGPLGQLLASIARVGLLILGFVTALGTLGVNITGIANLLPGVLILLYRPFDVGDRIDVSGLSGRVITVNLRYTELDAGNECVLVPNSKMLTDPIKVSKPSTGGAAG